LDDKVLRTLHVEVRVSMQQAFVGTLEDNLAFVQAKERKKKMSRYH